MTEKITLMIGGIQGEGIVSVGDTLIRVLSRAGYYAFGYRTFSSRIKGGHTNYIIDIDVKKILSGGDSLDLLVAFDQDSIALNSPKLKNGGVLIYDDGVVAKDLLTSLSSLPISIHPAPLTAIAKQHGTPLMKTTALLGLLGGILDIPTELLSSVIKDQFGRKGNEIILNNLSVLQTSYDLKEKLGTTYSHLRLCPADHSVQRASMMGNDAIAFGALMAGCRFVSAYPITPSSEIMEYLTKKFTQYNGVMVQTEDEISAITMAIGAAYGGARSMTATSGPGISLMMEAIGLSGMIETPVVIVDVQRGGPSTGLPTKHEQSDLSFLYHGPHGEIPSIVLTPYSVETCFQQTIEAFHLAEHYQCPVFILSDLHLGLSRQTTDALDQREIYIDRGKIATNLEPQQGSYKRFLFTEDGISPRTLPGEPHGMHHVTGIEHVEQGKPNEGADNRRRMMDKRLGKIKSLQAMDGINLYEAHHKELLILSVGSNHGIVKRAVEEGGYSAAYGTFTRIKPFPISQFHKLGEKYQRILVVENNATGQLAGIIRQEAGFHDKIHSLLKYDGTPFKLKEIQSKVEELIR